MNVVFLSPELLSLGGIQRQNRLMIAGIDELLDEENGHLTVLALNDPKPQSVHPELTELRCTSIDYFAGDRAAYLRELLWRSHHANLVIYGLLGFALMRYAQVLPITSCRRLLMIHGIEAWERRSLWHSIAVKSMYGYISVSRHTLDRFRLAYNISPTKYSVILPNVVSPELLHSVHLARDTISSSRARLLTVSAMRSHDKEKGIDTVIRALPLVLERFPGLSYTIIGDGPDRTRLEQLAIELGVSNVINFRGSVTDAELQEAYADCDVFTLPSAKEGFGFVFIEAMAYGKPVVAARAGATPEVVINRETGILVDYGSPQHIADALAELIEHPELRSQMGRNGRMIVETRYSYTALKQNLAGIVFE